jgi:hypothetical protein
MSFNALSLAKLGVGFGALAVASIGLLAPTPVEAESTLHQGGPDRQVVDRITRPANWTPWDADVDLFVRQPAPQPPPDRTTVTPGALPPDPVITPVVAEAIPNPEHLARLAQQDVDLLKKQAAEVFAARQQEAMVLALALVLALDEDDDD